MSELLRTAARRSPAVDAELVRRFDRAAPRYTSYPTALEFHEGVGESDYRERLAAADARAPAAPLALYVHIPFCERLCTFCACHFIATPHREVATAYVADLERELELLAGALPRRRTLAQLQWGGGTPTYLPPAELERLHAAIARQFTFAPGAEVAIEVDPRFTTRAHLASLARLGFNRLSMGVQDFTPAVQEAIGRRQTFAETRDLVLAARALGFGGGLNFDLVYGLPHQDEESFDTNLDRLLELAPDRVALYSFAWVPWARPHQKRIDPETLPAGEEKLALFLAARERLLEAGYEAVGIDHFARPDDELARAARAGRLDRNFMGYSAEPPAASVAVGVTGIGELDGAYFQNERRLSDWRDAIAAGKLPVRRGYLLDADDRIRQHVIGRLLCDFEVDKTEVARRFAIDFDEYFSDSLATLADWNRASGGGLVADHPDRLTVAPTGRPFVRSLCTAFDRHLAARTAGGRPAFSRAI